MTGQTHLTGFLPLLLISVLACLIVSLDPSSVCSLMFSSAHRTVSTSRIESCLDVHTPDFLLFWTGRMLNLPGLNDIFAKHVGYVPHEGDLLLELCRVYAGAVWQNLVSNLEAECWNNVVSGRTRTHGPRTLTVADDGVSGEG